MSQPGLLLGVVTVAIVLFDKSLCVSDRTLATIQLKEDIVTALAVQAASLFERRPLSIADCECSLHSCSYDFPGAECHDILGTLTSLCGERCTGQQVDFNQTIFRMPPGTDPANITPGLKESICTYRGLDGFFTKLYPESFVWTYIGTTDGHFRRWPAAGRAHNDEGEPLLGGCASYDPRIRPWYIAASTGPKDIVFIIDKSLSMLDPPPSGGPLKWNVTIDALTAVIGTLGNLDYFNVVAFSDSAEQLYTKQELIQASKENKDVVQNALKNQVPNGGTSFDVAFKLAFSLLTTGCDSERRTCSNCEKVILFLTDGMDTSAQLRGGIRPSEMANRIAGYQDKLEAASSKRASIFTFSMGSDADDSIPRQIACSNNGAWSYIRDNDDPLTAMRSYYIFLTGRRETGSPIWVEPYEDASGLGMLTTVAFPIFSEPVDNVRGVFLGVAGQDVLFRELNVTAAEQDELLDNLVQRGSTCQRLIDDPCQLQVLRNVHANEATCIDRFPIPTVPPTEEDRPQCFTNGRSFYKRFSAPLRWEDARDRCTEDDGSLVSIGTDEELAFVANMASDDGSWVGAKRSRNTFEWINPSLPDLDARSPYWGIGQPDSFQGVEDCVSIDTRGPNSNLDDVRCDTTLTFICEYSSDRSCTGRARNPLDEPNLYFTVPPVGLCVNAETSLARASTLDVAKSLASEEVMCKLGAAKPDVEFRCCFECLDDIPTSAIDNSPQRTERFTEPRGGGSPNDNGISPGIVIGLVAPAVVVFSMLVICFWWFQRRQPYVEEEKQEHPHGQPSGPPTERSVPTQYRSAWNTPTASIDDNRSIQTSIYS